MAILVQVEAVILFQAVYDAMWGIVLALLVGALIMVYLAELIRTIPKLGAAHHTLFGILLIVIVIFLPNGIVGDFKKLKRLLRFGGTV
jgi:ABC-type branched-subunit amino acid transport system permease subunit